MATRAPHDREAPAFEKPSGAVFRAMHTERPLVWYDYADAWLSFPLGKVLDYGCGTGTFLTRIGDRASERWGVDLDEDALAEASRSGATVRAISPGKPLPFSDGQFDTVIIMEVIEHVADERAVLSELLRVLAPGGRLLLTTPHKGTLTFLDPGNFKFVAPRLHEFIHRTLLRQRGYYEERFGASRRTERGMIADFTLDQTPWHRHYPYRQIRSLTPPELSTVAWSAYSPAFRALWCLRLALGVLTFGLMNRLPPPLSWLARRLSRVESRRGDQLVVLFEKTPSACPRE